MSVAVPIPELSAAIAQQIGWCYLLTVSDDSHARILAVTPTADADGVLHFTVGTSTGANVAARSGVTLLFPPATATAMSLIIDGTATVDGSNVSFTPTWAVLHRSALPD